MIPTIQSDKYFDLPAWRSHLRALEEVACQEPASQQVRQLIRSARDHVAWLEEHDAENWPGDAPENSPAERV